MLITPLSNLFSFGRKRREQYRERVLSSLRRVTFTAVLRTTYHTLTKSKTPEEKQVKREFFQQGGLAGETIIPPKPEKITKVLKLKEWRYSKVAVEEAQQVIAFYRDCIPETHESLMEELIATLDMLLEGDVPNVDKERFESLILDLENDTAPGKVKPVVRPVATKGKVIPKKKKRKR